MSNWRIELAENEHIIKGFTGSIKTNLIGKCGQCDYYQPYVKSYHRLAGNPVMLLCRGKCANPKKSLGMVQRTQTCKRFEQRWQEEGE